jgi:hypothetical protein
MEGAYIRPFQGEGRSPIGSAPEPPEPLSVVATRINERLAKQFGALLSVSERVGGPTVMPGDPKVAGGGVEPNHLSWQLRKMEMILSDIEHVTEGMARAI